MDSYIYAPSKTAMKDKVYKFIRTWREKGFISAANKTCRFLLLPLYYRNRLIFAKCDQPGSFAYNGPDVVDMDMVCRELSEKEIMGISFVDERKKRFFVKYFSYGCKCYGTICDGSIISYAFVSLKEMPEPILRFTVYVEDDQVYVFDVFVAPRHRKKKAASRMVKKLIDVYSDRGGRELICSVAEDNTAARRFWRHLGFRPFKVVEHRRYLWMRYNHSRVWDELRDTF